MDLYLSSGADKPRTVDAGRRKIRAKSTKYVSFPANRFRRIGACVQQYAEGFLVDFGRVIVASSLDEDFIKRLLISSDNNLIRPPEEALWTIRKVGSKKFYIARKGV